MLKDVTLSCRKLVLMWQIFLKQYILKLQNSIQIFHLLFYITHFLKATWHFIHFHALFHIIYIHIVNWKRCYLNMVNIEEFISFNNPHFTRNCGRFTVVVKHLYSYSSSLESAEPMTMQSTQSSAFQTAKQNHTSSKLYCLYQYLWPLPTCHPSHSDYSPLPGYTHRRSSVPHECSTKRRPVTNFFHKSIMHVGEKPA